MFMIQPPVCIRDDPEKRTKHRLSRSPPRSTRSDKLIPSLRRLENKQQADAAKRSASLFKSNVTRTTMVDARSPPAWVCVFVCTCTPQGEGKQVSHRGPHTRVTAVSKHTLLPTPPTHTHAPLYCYLCEDFHRRKVLPSTLPNLDPSRLTCST